MTRDALIAVFLTVGCVHTVQAQPWVGILDPTRAIDWTNSGIPGGVPSRTTICATINASTYGNGSSDATGGIQSALNSCAPGATQESQAKVLMLSAGTFRINTSLSVPGYVTLRGAGADQTILSVYGSSTGAINMGSTQLTPGNAVSITGGSSAGSTSITVSSTANIVVGGYLHISELNDPSYVTNTGNNGTCTWCDGYWNGTRDRGQIVEVVSVSGSTIGISPGLYSAYTLTPQAVPFNAIKYAGVENLQVYGNGTAYGSNYYFTGCAYCWIKGVEGNYTGTTSTSGDHAEIDFGYRDEIRDSYFSNAYSQGTGSHNSSITLAYKSSGVLVENNIFERVQAPVTVVWGAAGNVIAYNYSTGGYAVANTVYGGIDIHAPHPQFNLFESNVVPFFLADGVWGSSSTGTVYRNWAIGTTDVCSPLTAGRNIVTTSCAWAYQAARALQFDFASTSYNIVGNVAGSSMQSGLSGAKVAQVLWPSTRSYSSEYGFTFGYDNYGDTGTDPLDSSKPYATAFLHGNYNNIDGSLVWAVGITHTLPPSFYRSTKPGWFGNNAWPAIGPDVTGSGPGGYTSAIPAQTCYASIGGTEGGAGSPHTYNADACYAAAAPKPAPPTGLTATAH